MNKLSLVALIAAFILALVASPASANSTLCYKAHGVRTAVVKKHGKRAPGRNICRFGLKGGKPATSRHKAQYLRALKRLNAPAPPLLVRVAVRPFRAPAGTATASVAAGGFASCVAQHESGGNPTTDTGNGYYGKYQFDSGTWRAATGLGGTADQYPEAVQDRAFASWYAKHPSAWPRTGPACGG